MSSSDATLVGEVQAVTGSVVSIRIRPDLPSLVLVAGSSYRVGQLGSFVRIPVGYTDLFGVCTQVGATANVDEGVDSTSDARWMTVTLFGEAVGGVFERGVGQFPTFADEVHIVTNRELERIYASSTPDAAIRVGTIASASGIGANLDLARLVSRHSAIVGSSGSGKSNLVATILDAIATQGFPSARVVVIDPHGEYAQAVSGNGKVFSASPGDGQEALTVPYWCLPFDEFLEVSLGELNQSNEAVVRSEVEKLRSAAAKALAAAPDAETVTADSPIPFSARQLWFDLIDFENRTYEDNASTKPTAVTGGDPDRLVANVYLPHAIGSGAPYKGPKRGIVRNLELMRNRLLDSRYGFLFEPGEDLTPNLEGAVVSDLDQLVRAWVGHDHAITVFDLSSVPADVLPLIAGAVLRTIYDALYWAADASVSGRNQPLLIVLEEAHLFLRDGDQSVAHRTVSRIAKEGRKYGVGLMLVTQRPTEVDSTALSQCGTMMALRLTNSADRARVTATIPDDLANLGALLPALRTGEMIATGEAVALPSRIRLNLARHKLDGGDPDLAERWRSSRRPSSDDYVVAISNWRALSFSGSSPTAAVADEHVEQVEAQAAPANEEETE